MANPLMTGFNQGVDPSDQWNKLTPDDARGPLTLDPQAQALARQFYAIRDSIAGDQVPIWNPDNPVGTETLQSVGMPQPTTYAGPVGQFIDPATGRMTTQGMARMDNPAMGFDTGGIGGMAGHFTAYHGSPHSFDAFDRQQDRHRRGRAGVWARDVSRRRRGRGAELQGCAFGSSPPNSRQRGCRRKPTSGFAMRLVRHPAPRSKDIPRLFAGFKDDPVAQEILAAHGNGQIGMSSPTGHMYEVQVNADPAHFLDWDKPLSEQHPVVQQALTDIIRHRVAAANNT